MNLVLDFLLISGIIVNFIILMLLIKASKKELPIKLLMLFFITLLFVLLHTYADFHNLKFLFLATFIFNDILELFIGPLLYLYIKSLFENHENLVRKNIFHFIPVALYLVLIAIPIFISFLQQEPLFTYLEFLNSIRIIVFTILMLYLILYLLLSLKLFYRYRKAMQSNFSTLSESEFGWVEKMLLGTIFIGCIDVVLNNFRELFFETEVEYDFVTLILIVVLIIYLGYYGVNQSKILLPDFLLIQNENRLPIKKDIVSQTEKVELEQFKTELIRTLHEDKVYLDEELTLNKLASLIDTSDKKLSFLLNQYMNTTFYDFVNKYRVQSVKEKLASKDFTHLTLLGIAYESGFKSKTSFNRIFKKETGQSPSEYKRSL